MGSYQEDPLATCLLGCDLIAIGMIQVRYNMFYRIAIIDFDISLVEKQTLVGKGMGGKTNSCREGHGCK